MVLMFEDEQDEVGLLFAHSLSLHQLGGMVNHHHHFVIDSW